MKRLVFVMGSNGPAGSTQLRYALNDVEKMKTALSHPRCGFEVESPSEESKKWEVYDRLEKITSSCSINDTLICHFSGHGELLNGKLFLLWNNTDANNIRHTALSINNINQILTECKAQNKLLILDCCHAGAAVNRAKKNDEAKITIQDDNYLVLLASSRLERAREIEELQGSFLTSNICDAIGEKFNEADLDKDGRISTNDLKNWLEIQYLEYNKQKKEEDWVPQPYLHGQFKGKIYLTLSSSNSLERENVADSEEILRELHKYQLESIKYREEIKLYKSQLEAKDTQIEIYKKHNQTLEKIIFALSAKQINPNIDLVAMSEAKKFEKEKVNVNINIESQNYGSIINTSRDFNANLGDSIYVEEKQSLAEAAKEIQELLEQLDRTYSQNKTAQEMTNAEKMTLALKVIEQIQSDQTLKLKIINALEPGRTEALSELLNHPAGNFITAAIEDWQSKNDS